MNQMIYLIWLRIDGVNKMNMNELAREVTLEEGMKQSVSIAQVKEVLKITFSILAEMEPEEYDKLIRRYRRN